MVVPENDGYSPDVANIEQLREKWERALERNKWKDAVSALLELEKLDPTEPRWSHRAGDAYRRLNQPKEAEDAFIRAMQRYAADDLMPHAMAMAKLVLSMNPSRTDVMATLEQAKPAKARAPLRAPPPPPPTAKDASTVAQPAQVRAPSAPVAKPASQASVAVARPPTPAPTPPPPPPPPSPSLPTPPSLPPPPSVSIPISLDSEPPPLSVIPTRNAISLTVAKDAASDEVRFENERKALVFDLGLDDVVLSTKAPEVPTLERLRAMAGAALFRDLPSDVLGELAERAELVELSPGAFVMCKDESADALYSIVEGTAHVHLGDAPPLAVGEGDVLGEACLLDEGVRQADVRAATPLVLLRIARDVLADIAQRHPELGEQLLKVLANRLVSNVMQRSELFASFDPETRVEVARMFELRRAAPGTILCHQGKRSDGLYVVLAGQLVLDAPGNPRVARGSLFGQHSLLSHAPAEHTIRVSTDALVLRLPSTSFSTFAATYPPALSHLAESRPVTVSYAPPA